MNNGLRRTPTRASRRRGYTLVELLVAAAISIALMAGLWAMLSIYERLFSKGEATVEEAQLVRTLLEQISDDLQSAIPDSATGLPGATAAVRRFGLFGTSRSLVVDVLQPVPAQIAPPTTPDAATSLAAVRQVPELHTVEYRLRKPADATQAATPARSGLIRRELDWETPATSLSTSPAPAAAAESSPSSPSLDAGAETAAAESPPAAQPSASEDPNAEDPNVVDFPEVIEIAFRYYDGAAWSEAWNSLDRKSLPAAVEVRLTLGDPAAPRTPSEEIPVADTMEGLEETLDQALLEPPTPKGKSYRFLVWIPSTAIARATEPVAEGLEGAGLLEPFLFEPAIPEPAMPEPVILEPVPPPLPPLPSVEPPTVEDPAREPFPSVPTGPDQWMRFGR